RPGLPVVVPVPPGVQEQLCRSHQFGSHLDRLQRTPARRPGPHHRVPSVSGFPRTQPHSNLSLAALPSLDWNAYAQSLRRLPVYFSWDASGAALDRSEPGFSTGVLPRLDFSPHLTVPVTTDVG